jgi:predicted alpha/beta hydrolase
MYWIAPPLAHLFGFMPGSRLGIGEDLPAGVLLEWSRWIRLPNYFFDDPTLDAEARFSRVRTPILSLGFDDDPWATRVGIDMLVSRFRNAPLTRREIAGIRSDTGSIGHMGYFRQRSGGFLWPETVDWLLSANSADATTGSDRSRMAESRRPDASPHAPGSPCTATIR